MLVALAIFSAFAGTSSIYLFIEDMRSRRRFGWKQVESLIRKMLNDFNRSGYEPDLILGVGRGGAILAGILAGNLGHLPLATIDTEIDHSTNVSRVNIRYPECCPSLEGLNVLIVVGELYSGEDLRYAIEFADQRSPKDIKTASLLTHPAASVRPDFVGQETNKPLSAPWRISDHYKVHRV